jgi:cell division protease FtsH
MPVDNNGDRHIKTPQPRHMGSSVLLWLSLLIFLNMLLWAQPARNHVPYSEFISRSY